MKTFRKSSLITSVALLLVAIVALGGATFAWFSTKTTASASSLSAKTTQGSNLMISEAKDTGWDQTITFANDDTTALDPVTTNDLSTWKTAKADGFDKVVASSEGYVDSTSYITQRVFVKLDAAEGTTKELTVTLAPTVNKDEDGKEIGSLNYYRVAVKPVVAEGLSNAQNATTVYYADANNLNASAQYAQYTTQADKTLALGTIAAKDADGAQAVYAYDFYIWFEGEDADCKDSNAVNDISLALNFQ